jgi:zinc transport system ATP-binding protein
MSYALEVKKLNFSYQKTQILKDISFKLKAGQTIGVIGPNGGGKSTLFKVLCGLLSPTSGEIHYFGSKEFPFESISYIPQKIKTNDTLPLTTLEYVCLGNEQKIEKAKALLKRIGLESKRDDLLRELSGGQKQRAMIAKSLMNAPKIMLLDEPTTGLDAEGQDQLLVFLKEVATDSNTSILLIEHNLNSTLKFCDDVLCLNKTHHWHNHKSHLNKEILESFYHCEFEHALLHDHNIEGEHKKCHTHSPEDSHE